MVKLAKKTNAKKYSSQPEQLDHVFYEPQRIIAKLRNAGADDDTIKQAVVDYITSERQKCIDDVAYFAAHYGFVVGRGSSGIIPFEIEQYQDDLLKSFQNDKYVIVNKSRQLGVSTVLVFYALWFSIFSTGKRCLVVAHRRESAEEFITKLKTAYEFLPDWLKPSCTLYSKSTVEFDTKSVVKAITSNPHAARSFSATVFLVDEAAFIDDADEVIKGIMPTVSSGDGKLIAISSPNGNSDANWFYKTFTFAKAGLNGWRWFELPWHVCKAYVKNPNFKEEQIRLDNGNTDKFSQEYCCNFNINLSSMFTRDALDAFQPDSNIKNKAFGGATYEDTFYIWDVAQPGRKYTIGVDCASNKASARDFTAFQVIDTETAEQMAEYIGKLPTEVFVDILVKAARHYNNALLVVEANSYSEMVFYLLEQRGYTNIWYDSGKSDPGFHTNRATRPMIIEKLLLFYNHRAYSSLLKSARLKVQMQNFSAKTVYADGSRKMEASKGNDDACMALGLALIPLPPPREHIHRPFEFSDIATPGKEISSGEYSDEYLEYHSKRMNVSKQTLASRLKLYHDIKMGVYEDTGMDPAMVRHPVEEFEQQQAAAEFIGAEASMMRMDSMYDSPDETISLLNSRKTFGIDDLFSEEFQSLQDFHRNVFRY